MKPFACRPKRGPLPFSTVANDRFRLRLRGPLHKTRASVQSWQTWLHPRSYNCRKGQETVSDPRNQTLLCLMTFTCAPLSYVRRIEYGPCPKSCSNPPGNHFLRREELNDPEPRYPLTFIFAEAVLTYSWVMSLILESCTRRTIHTFRLRRLYS